MVGPVATLALGCVPEAQCQACADRVGQRIVCVHMNTNDDDGGSESMNCPTAFMGGGKAGVCGTLYAVCLFAKKLKVRLLAHGETTVPASYPSPDALPPTC